MDGHEQVEQMEKVTVVDFRHLPSSSVSFLSPRKSFRQSSHHKKKVVGPWTGHAKRFFTCHHPLGQEKWWWTRTSHLVPISTVHGYCHVGRQVGEPWLVIIYVHALSGEWPTTRQIGDVRFWINQSGTPSKTIDNEISLPGALLPRQPVSISKKKLNTFEHLNAKPGSRPWFIVWAIVTLRTRGEGWMCRRQKDRKKEIESTRKLFSALHLFLFHSGRRRRGHLEFLIKGQRPNSYGLLVMFIRSIMKARTSKKKAVIAPSSRRRTQGSRWKPTTQTC